MKTLHKITSKRFETRICEVAEAYGFKTVGQAIKIVEKANINAKWCYGTQHIRSGILLRILRQYVLTN
jgi:hypothetical protein